MCWAGDFGYVIHFWSTPGDQYELTYFCGRSSGCRFPNQPRFFRSRNASYGDERWRSRVVDGDALLERWVGFAAQQAIARGASSSSSVGSA